VKASPIAKTKGITKKISNKTIAGVENTQAIMFSVRRRRDRGFGDRGTVFLF
jgi:hypothetical protein